MNTCELELDGLPVRPPATVTVRLSAHCFPNLSVFFLARKELEALEKEALEVSCHQLVFAAESDRLDFTFPHKCVFFPLLGRSPGRGFSHRRDESPSHSLNYDYRLRKLLDQQFESGCWTSVLS